MTQDLHTPGKLVVTLPSDREIRMERWFDAPRDLVFRLWTDGNRIPEFWGPRGHTTTVDVWDFREGGKWRLVSRDAEGNEHPFRGEFREISAPEVVEWTFEYEPFAGHISIDRLTMEDHDGRTRMISVSTFQTVEGRDAMVDSGMETGAGEMYERFEELLVRELASA